MDELFGSMVEVLMCFLGVEWVSIFLWDKINGIFVGCFVFGVDGGEFCILDDMGIVG